MNRRVIGLAAVALLVAAGQASAVIFTGTGINGESGGELAASAEFVINPDGDLEITLTNTTESDVMIPTDVLTAVFFNIADDPLLTPLSAVLGPDSEVLFDFDDVVLPGDPVGGEWTYRDDLTGAPYDTTYGISSSGLDGLFGTGHLVFPGPDLDSPDSPNGLNYGIVSAGDDETTGNAPVTGGKPKKKGPGYVNNNPLIKNQVVFTFELPEGAEIDLNEDISEVNFQYGTSLDGPNIIPEPSSLMVWGFLALSFVWWQRRRSTQR